MTQRVAQSVGVSQDLFIRNNSFLSYTVSDILPLSHCTATTVTLTSPSVSSFMWSLFNSLTFHLINYAYMTRSFIQVVCDGFWSALRVQGDCWSRSFLSNYRLLHWSRDHFSSQDRGAVLHSKHLISSSRFLTLLNNKKSVLSQR